MLNAADCYGLDLDVPTRLGPQRSTTQRWWWSPGGLQVALWDPRLLLSLDPWPGDEQWALLHAPTMGPEATGPTDLGPWTGTFKTVSQNKPFLTIS